MIADSASDLQNILILINKVNEKYGVGLNTKNIKVMAVSRNNQIVTNEQRIKQFKEFKYLRCYITQNIFDPEVQVKRRHGVCSGQFRNT